MLLFWFYVLCLKPFNMDSNTFSFSPSLFKVLYSWAVDIAQAMHCITCMYKALNHWVSFPPKIIYSFKL